ncbi:MAG: glutaredoxin family protein [Solirubrobacterales bacterium]|nr:glutaredoxin family protein [Solirubrobacterales bacterium]
MIVTVLSRPGCHLCEEAITELEAFRASRETAGEPGFSVEIVDIESDDALHREYLERIPVIRFGEAIVSEFSFDAEALESILQGQGRQAG